MSALWDKINTLVSELEAKGVNTHGTLKTKLDFNGVALVTDEGLIHVGKDGQILKDETELILHGPINTPNPNQPNVLLQKMIVTRVAPGLTPYLYFVGGQAGGTYTTRQSAESTLTNIKHWADKIGAEVKLLETRGSGKNFQLVVDITDPAALEIDKLIAK